MAEVFTHSVPQNRGLLGEAGGSIEIHDQPECRIVWSLSRPSEDELFRLRIQISFAERRGIDRVEQLLQFGDVHLDQLAVAGERIACGIRGLVHGLHHRASRASVRPFSTSNTPSTSRARTSAIWRSVALSTTPSSIVRPFLTMM